MDQTRVTWSSKFEFILTCIGYAVGLGNIVRFPYLCFKNGGGAFLVPYCVFLVLVGLPMAVLEFSIGQYVGLSVYQFWNICPLLKGIGLFSVIINTLLLGYFVYIQMLTTHYFVTSFRPQLPWNDCSNAWNTDRCLADGSGSNISSTLSWNSTQATAMTYNASNNATMKPGVSAGEEYLFNHVLAISNGITDIGHIQWQLWLALVASWLMVYLVTIRGIQSSGKAIYVTGTLPYIMLTVFVIRGATLPGSLQGVLYYLVPEWRSLLKPVVWFSAAQQIFFSLGISFGCFITMSSYNKFNNNCIRDAFIATLVNSGTSVYAGFAVFSVIGFMAHESGLDMHQVMQSGPGLVFVVYPRALAAMPVPQFWSVLFFLMLLTLSVSSRAVHYETVVSSITDKHPSLRTPGKRALVSLAVFAVMVIIGTPFTTRAGMYLFNFIDWYATAFGPMIVAIVECIFLAWIYGADKICSHILEMTGIRSKVLRIYLHVCWKVLSPMLCLMIFIVNAVKWKAVTYGDYIYPTWTTPLGWLLALLPLLPIPVIAFLQILQSKKATLKERLVSVCTPSEWIIEQIRKRKMEANQMDTVQPLQIEFLLTEK